ncbi:hypothetical protein [Streptomyces sp. NPDC088258]|uniref:hypothetical protein n=1 Tax=Streptomyces sp. NPDC088258 TaxID=3365849 RepID=UPI0038038B14
MSVHPAPPASRGSIRLGAPGARSVDTLPWDAPVERIRVGELVVLPWGPFHRAPYGSSSGREPAVPPVLGRHPAERPPL